MSKLDERECTTCLEIKTEWRSSQPNMCRDCYNFQARKSYEKNKAVRNARNEKYRKSNWDKIKQQTYARLDPQKHKARAKVNYAVKTGKLVKEDCRECSATNVHFHHTNGYDKDNWFTGVWLCTGHHAKLHKELRWTTQ